MIRDVLWFKIKCWEKVHANTNNTLDVRIQLYNGKFKVNKIIIMESNYIAKENIIMCQPSSRASKINQMQ